MQPRTAVVIGGASGLGRIWARRMAAAGARVAIIDIDRDAIAETTRAIPGVRAFPADVTDLAGLTAAVDTAVAHLDGVDRVVHSAAIMPASPAIDDDPARVRRVMRINYEGTVHAAHAALPHLRRQGHGQLVFFGSIIAEAPTPHMSAYAASKAAVNAYVEILQHELEDEAVTVHLVLPPMTDTPLLRQSQTTSNPRSLQLGIERNIVADPEQIISESERQIAAGRTRIYPHFMSRALHTARRLSPRLLWRVIQDAERV